MAIFDRLDRAISSACDRQFSVSAIIDGMCSTPNGRPVPDLNRGEIHIKGIFDQIDEFATVEIGKRDREGNSLRTLISGQKYQLSVDVARYPGAKGIRQGDRVTLDDARRFEVISLQPDGQSRIVLLLLAA